MARVFALLFDPQQVAIMRDALDRYTADSPCDSPATRLRDRLARLSYRHSPAAQEADMRDFGTLPASLRIQPRNGKGMFK